LAKVAVIGGSGLENMLRGGKVVDVETRYGKSPPVTIGTIDAHAVVFVARHGAGHTVPPHKVNYRAIIAGIRNLGVERVIATNAVGAINRRYKPGDIAIPLDIIDFTKSRPGTLYNEAPVTHTDVTQPYCPGLRQVLVKSAKKHAKRVWKDSVIACTEGPRFETPAEIRMFSLLGCDLVGMTGAPEVFLAREAGLCYATICFVSNMAAGLQAKVTHEEVEKIGSRMASTIRAIASETIAQLGSVEACTCRTLPKRGA